MASPRSRKRIWGGSSSDTHLESKEMEARCDIAPAGGGAANSGVPCESGGGAALRCARARWGRRRQEQGDGGNEERLSLGSEGIHL